MAEVKAAKIFLCYAREDILAVKAVYGKLLEAGFNPWMDKKDLLPGQKWRVETPKALRAARFVIIFFSKRSVSKQGYVQREFKLALDTLEEMPEGRLYIIPVRLDNCRVPESFGDIHYCDLFEEDGFELVLKTIKSQLDEPKQPEKVGVPLEKYQRVLKELEVQKKQQTPVITPESKRTKPVPPPPGAFFFKRTALVLAGVAVIVFGIYFIILNFSNNGSDTDEKPAPVEAPKSRLDIELENADNLFNDGEYLQAEKKLKEILQSNPEHRQAREKLLLVLQKIAGGYFQSKNYTLPADANALETCREILKYDSENTFARNMIQDIEDYYVDKGDAALNRKEYSAAINDYEKALSINNNSEINEKIARAKQLRDEAAPKFRSTPHENYSPYMLEEMILKNGFADTEYNENAPGFANQYERQQNDKIIFDHASGLMWQQSCSGEMFFDRTQAYIDQLNREGFAGYNDWRLPTLEEAMTLMEPTKLKREYYIDRMFELGMWGGDIWTADRYTEPTYDITYTWYVSFRYGNCSIGPDVNLPCVLAVRSR